MSEPIITDSTSLIGITQSWLRVETPADPGLAVALKMLVDEGEAEAIAPAYGRGYQLVLNDRQARTVARSMGLSFIGTIGVLVKAKQAGLILTLKPLLDSLELNGFYLSEALKVEALKLVGE